MRLNFMKLSPAHNTTILITDYVSPSDYAEIAGVVMSYEYLHAEQVGFLVAPRDAGAKLRLEMSGGEFCGNAVLAAAACGVYKGIAPPGDFAIESSGMTRPLICRAKVKSVNLFEIKAEMPQFLAMEAIVLELGEARIAGRIVELSGISHFVTDYLPSEAEFDRIIALLETRTTAQALGVIPYRQLGDGKYEIRPYVFVRNTNSRLFEQACGSGSLSLGMHLRALRGETGFQVYQPGGVIGVEIGAKNFIATDVALTCDGAVVINSNQH